MAFCRFGLLCKMRNKQIQYRHQLSHSQQTVQFALSHRMRRGWDEDDENETEVEITKIARIVI